MGFYWGFGMWSELTAPWRACFEQAWTAYGKGSLPIGAVIVDGRGDVIASGRNQVSESPQFPSVIANRELMHAELQALLALDDSRVGRREAELYTSMEPCPMCLGAWFMSSMGVLHFASRDPYAGGSDLLGTTWYMRYKRKRAFGPLDAPIELSLKALSAETHLRLWGELSGAIKDRWEAMMPEVVQIGHSLVSDDELSRLRQDNATAEEGLEYVYEFVTRATRDTPS